MAGNRTYAQVTQATIGATTHDNDRSYLYGYDDLQRLALDTTAGRCPWVADPNAGRLRSRQGLILADMGKLAADNQSILNDPAVALRRKLEWFPDSLGNWSGTVEPGMTPGGLSRTDDTPSTSPTTTEIRHEVDAFNRIEAVVTDSQPVAHVNDVAGNLVFDGTYVYQYDAWNRLVEVNEAGTLTTADFTSDGKISQTTGHEIGLLLVRFAYDGLGRLITAQRPLDNTYPAPPCTTEHYYYDDTRRIQEVDDNGTPAVASDDQTRHEYVHRPDGMDAIVLQSYRDTGGIQQPLYVFQDANSNVMALVSESGGILEQYQWEPYGPMVTLDVNASPRPQSSLGHQGLFFYALTTPGEPMAPDVEGLYYNRNRWFGPRLGRFLEKDPNETAMPVLTARLMIARSSFTRLRAFRPQGHLRDGMNLFQYLRSNPVNGVDPMGLMFDFSYVGQTATQGINSEMGALDAQRVGIAKGFLIGLLGYMVVNETWGVGGGMSSSAFDMFMEGVDLSMQGAWSQGEMLMVMAEATVVGAAFRTWQELEEALNRALDDIFKAPGHSASKAASEVIKILEEMFAVDPVRAMSKIALVISILQDAERGIEQDHERGYDASKTRQLLDLLLRLYSRWRSMGWR